MSQTSPAERQQKAISELLRTDQVETLRQRLDSGDFDPALTPGVILQLAGHPSVDLLDRWLAADVDPNGGRYANPLVRAASRGLVANVERLLAAGADPNIGEYDSFRPLTKAIRGGHDAVAQRLLAAGAELPEFPNLQGLAWAAADAGCFGTLRIILDRRLEALGTSQTDREAMLLSFAPGDEKAIVDLLLELRDEASTDDQPTGPADPDGNDHAVDVSESWAEDDEDDDDEEEWREPDLPELPALSQEEAEHYAPDAVQARLRQAARREDFQEAVKALEMLSGNRARQRWQGSAVDMHLDSRSTGGRLLKGSGFPALREALGAPSCTLVLSRQRVVLFPSVDLLEVLVAFGVSAPNVDITQADVLATFRDYPFDLHRIRGDLMAGYVTPKPRDRAAAEALALRYLALKPEVIFEDDPVNIVANRLMKDGEVLFWWD